MSFKEEKEQLAIKLLVSSMPDAEAIHQFGLDLALNGFVVPDLGSYAQTLTENLQKQRWRLSGLMARVSALWRFNFNIWIVREVES